MTPQGVVSLAPASGTLALIAMMLTAMAACFFTTEATTEAVRSDRV